MVTHWKIGDRLQNRWEIYQILQGGMGIVYIVYDHEVGEVFAAKTFQDEIFARNPTIADRFTQEALAWVNLDLHENVTSARFVERISGKPFLFLEYVSGGDLGNWIGTPRLTQDQLQVLRFAIQFCDGMTHALSKGIKAHRDIKPQNCLITRYHTLKVTDFGLAKAMDDVEYVSYERERVEDETKGVRKLWERLARRECPHRKRGELLQAQDKDIKLSQSGRALGTPTHMAPEQFEDAKHVDVRADIYSFGVMLFQMITGQLPFDGRSWNEFHRLHKTQIPTTIPSSPLSEVVAVCLAKDPSQRFADFNEIRERLVKSYRQQTGTTIPALVTHQALTASSLASKGVSLENLGRYAEGITYYDRALEIDPHLTMAWNNKGDALGKMGRYEEALACLDQALRLDPRMEQAWCNKGSILDELGRSEEALLLFDRAIDLNPHWVAPWYNKGNTLDRLGRPADALACYDHTLELDPWSGEAWSNKGTILEELERHDEALLCYSHALEVNPNLEQAWYHKAVLLDLLQRHEDAVESFEHALALKPDDEWNWYGKGVALQKLSRLEEALNCYERVISTNPNEEKAWINKGGALLGLHRYEAAIHSLDRALALNPHNKGAWLNKGVALRALGKMSEAMRCFSEANRL